MRKVLSVILDVIAGFFFYMVILTGFVKEPSTAAKWRIMLVFAVPAVVALFGGLALLRFHNWKRTSGIVLLSASGFTAFLIFTIACLFMTEEFRKMMQPDTLNGFGDFLTGGAVMVCLAGLGWLFLKTNGRSAQSESSK